MAPRAMAAGDGEEGRVVRDGRGARVHGPRPQDRHHRRQVRTDPHLCAWDDEREAAAAGDRGGHQGQGNPRPDANILFDL